VKIVEFTKDKLEEYTNLINQSRADWPQYRRFTAEQVESMYLSNRTYNQKRHLLAYLEEVLVGEAIALVDSSNQDNSTHGILYCSVLPEYRNSGVGQQLVESIKKRLKQNDVKSLETYVPHDCEVSKKFYDKLEFTETEREIQLRFYLDKEALEVKKPAGIQIRQAVFPEDKKDFLNLWNTSYSSVDSVFSKMTSESFDEFINFPGVESCCFLATKEDSGKVVGIISNYFDPVYNKEKGVLEATIEMIAVEETYLRKGIGSGLTVKSLTWMQSHGIRVAQARVFSSKLNSIEFFKRNGFSVEKNIIVYKINLSN